MRRLNRKAKVSTTIAPAILGIILICVANGSIDHCPLVAASVPCCSCRAVTSSCNLREEVSSLTTIAD
jgi:hypothetical protein